MNAETRLWLRFMLAAGLYRFRPTSWRGPVLLVVSILDVLVYAAALYIVMTTVFEFSGVDRFMTMLVGLVPLRWSVGCALQASRVANFVKVCQPVYPRSVLATAILAMGPSTVVFAISTVLLVIGLAVMLESPAGLGHIIVWGLFVTLVHLTWNALLVLAIIYTRMRHVLLNEGPIILAFVLLFILSPITYQFSDIPVAASQILTSMNPVSHLIAAYQNALWFGQDVSLQVLPLSALFCVGTLLLLSRLIHARVVYVPQEAAKAAYRLAWNGRFWHYSDAPAEAGEMDHVFRNWDGDLPWFTGRDLLYLLCPLEKDVAPLMRAFGELVPGSDSGQLLDSPLPIYAEHARNRLCIFTALLTSTGPVVLDRLLDNADEESIRVFCAFVASRHMNRGALVVMSGSNETANALVGFSPPVDDSAGF